VNDSEPESEFQETVNKSKAILKAVALAETFAENTRPLIFADQR
jgi:anthranilate/para-aminobenzoate synthase component I